MNINNTLLWPIRHFIYSRFADTTRPPSVEVTAAHFNISTEETSAYYQELHNRHAFFLDPGTLNIRMAWPFSAVATPFKVRAHDKTYYANCAWDMLGIPALLKCDAVIETQFTESNEPIQLAVKDDKVTNSELLIHFPISFSRWYDDLVFT